MTHDPFDDLYDAYPDIYASSVWSSPDDLLAENTETEGLHTVRVHRTPGLIRPWVASCVDCPWQRFGWSSLECAEAADSHGRYTVSEGAA